MKSREKVLRILLENPQGISGEKIAELCQISRAAVWKIINSLRDEGYKVQGTRNSGYTIEEKSEKLVEGLIRACLKKNYPEFAESRLEFFEEIDSTNSYAKSLICKAGFLRDFKGKLTEEGERLSNSIYIAKSQTGGRGRLGRNFYSPKDGGIYLSLLYIPEGGIKNPALLTAFSAVAVCRAVKKITGIELKIKWINDLFFQDRKVCGILAEGITNFESGLIEAAVIGIGINVNGKQEDLPEELKKIVGTLKSIKNTEINSSELAASICGETLRIMTENPKEVIKEYQSKSFLQGREITVFPLAGSRENSYWARVISIDDNAALVVENKEGQILHLSSGEVSIGSGNL